MQQIKTVCQTRKCEGNFWKITPVEQTRSIQVTCLSPQTTTDSLSLYFENKRRSDGGEVESVLFRADRKDCIVTFVKAEGNISYFINRLSTATYFSYFFYFFLLFLSEPYYGLYVSKTALLSLLFHFKINIKI